MSDPIVTGVLYRIREVANKDDPLHRTPYYGQTFGCGDPMKIAKRRWAKEVYDAKNTEKLVGLIAAMYLRGSDAFSFKILGSHVGPRSDVIIWMDENEKNLIAKAGGPLRDQEERLHQTLNLTSGGRSGDDAFSFVSSEALQRQKWRSFQKHVLEALDVWKSISNIRHQYCCSDGYKIGKAIGRVRQFDIFLKGRPDESTRRQWLIALPGWFDAMSKSDAAKLRYSRMDNEEPGLKETMKKNAAVGRSSAVAKAKKAKTISNPVWKQKISITLKERNARMEVSGSAALRIKNQKESIRLRRQRQLDACISDLERTRLQKKFDHNDKYNAIATAKKHAVV